MASGSFDFILLFLAAGGVVFCFLFYYFIYGGGFGGRGAFSTPQTPQLLYWRWRGLSFKFSCRVQRKRVLCLAYTNTLR